MKLIKRYLEAGAGANYIQLSHRRDAIQYAIAGIGKLYEANLDLLGRDPLNSEMEGSMHDWVIETLVQGAYLREYHLWEKDCKAYFAAMAERNGVELSMRAKPFTKLVQDTLAAFGVALPDNVLGAIETMRERVNVMKHDAGLDLDHFISGADYADALSGLEKFWLHLDGCERMTG